MYSTNRPAKSVSRPPLRAVRLLDQLRERLRYEHYSLRTEEAYVYWARAFIRFHGLRHPRDMGPAEVTAFLGHLAAARQVSAATPTSRRRVHCRPSHRLEWVGSSGRSRCICALGDLSTRGSVLP
jgi:hypothetical protein